jgi:hypothetical protein
MNRYLDAYVMLCGQLCKTADDYTKQNVKRHNQAMTELMRLSEQLCDAMPLAMAVYSELLKHTDLHVKHCAASDCLRIGIHTHQAVKVLKMICRRGDRMAAMAAKRSLEIWNGKLNPNAPF